MSLHRDLQAHGFGEVAEERPCDLRFEHPLGGPVAPKADEVRRLVKAWADRPDAAGWLCLTDQVRLSAGWDGQGHLLEAEIVDGDQTLRVQPADGGWHVVVAAEVAGSALLAVDHAFVGVHPDLGRKGAEHGGLSLCYRVYWPALAHLGEGANQPQVGAHYARLKSFGDSDGEGRA